MQGRKMVKWLAISVLGLAIVGIAAGSIVYAKVWSDRSTSAASVIADDSERGIVIASVAAGGPAAEAGMARGDILLQIDGEDVDDVRNLQLRLGELEPADEIKLTVLHGDEERILTATLGDQNGRAYLGVTPCGGCEMPALHFEGEAWPFRMPHLDDVPFLGEPGAMPDIDELGLGAVIVRVVEDSPAAAADLQEGDLILQVDGQQLDAENTLAGLITLHKPGENVTLRVERAGEDPFEVTVELGEHPDQDGTAYLGVEYRPAPRIRVFRGDVLPQDQLPGADLEQGAVIRDVAMDSPAEEAGLVPRDVISAIDGEPVEGPQGVVDTIAAREPGDEVTLTIYDIEEDAEREVVVTLAEHPDDADKAYLGVSIGVYFRAWRSDEDNGLEWRAPLQEFFEKFQGEGQGSFDPDQGFEFHWGPHGPMHELPFDFDFDFQLPPGLFENAPQQPEENTL